MKRLVLAVLVPGLFACGAAHDGSPCTDGTPQCQDTTTALFCENGYYRAIVCQGGCTAETVGDQVVVNCSYRNVQSGDECDQNATGLVAECQSLADGGEHAEVCGGDIWRDTPCPTGCADGMGGVGSDLDLGTCQ